MDSTNRTWISSPRRTPPEILAQTFVGDPEVAARLADQIRASVTTRSKHYNLIAGGRGIGKSHLLAVVLEAIRSDLGSDGVLAWLPDDPGGLASALHLFEAILAALGAPEVETTTIRSGREFDREAETGRARGRVVEFLAGRTLVLGIEQLDAVFAALGDAGQREFRAFLQEERCCTVIATVDALTRDFVDQDRVFFGFFGVHRLAPMDAGVTLRLLEALARARGDADLATKLGSDWSGPPATLRALHHLLGGLPSRYVDLVRSVADIEQPLQVLLRGLDAAALEYRAVRERLSPQQRLLVHWLVDQPGAAPVKDVARACSISEQTVSPQLRSLRGMGLVRATRVGRESWYEVCEPLWGLAPSRAVEWFQFLREWFADRSAALGGTSPPAAWLREVVEVEGEDPRRRLALPLPLRRLVEVTSPGT